MTIEDNKAFVQRWLDAWMTKDMALIDELFAQNYTVNGVLVGVEGVKRAVQFLHSVLSDISVELNEMIAEGDKVVIRWVVRGRHVGEFMGVPPTDKPIELKGINIYQVNSGKIVANQEQTNVLEVLQNLKIEQ